MFHLLTFLRWIHPSNLWIPFYIHKSAMWILHVLIFQTKPFFRCGNIKHSYIRRVGKPETKKYRTIISWFQNRDLITKMIIVYENNKLIKSSEFYKPFIIQLTFSLSYIEHLILLITKKRKRKWQLRQNGIILHFVWKW